jgi:3-deoxy-manno-octulosonate cytidylyltransferase (CMP-KDO synthetase)
VPAAPPFLVLIPARYGSTRLEAKALLKESGKFLVQHVQERALAAPGGPRVVVLTDDDRVVAAVRSYGGEVLLTSPDHASGTDRCAEAAQRLLGKDAEGPVVVNLQGDEPLFEPADLPALARAAADPGADLATCSHPFASPEAVRSPHAVKVYVDARGFALDFRRTDPGEAGRKAEGLPDPLHHVGVYAYRPERLATFSRTLPPSPRERAERLEQLRALEGGWRIRVVPATRAAFGIDTRADYDRFLERVGRPDARSP